MPSLLSDFVEVLGRAVVEPTASAMEAEDADGATVIPNPGPPSLDRGALLYCERSLELLVDLLSQLPTRRCETIILCPRAFLKHVLT